MRAFPNIKVRPSFSLDKIIQEITRRIIYKDEKWKILVTFLEEPSTIYTKQNLIEIFRGVLVT